MLQLHLGCGPRRLPGFVHVDLADFEHIDYRHDIAALPMFGDETVDLIYCAHALEYFDRRQVLKVLAEWRRVLKAGGLLRLAVPDFEALAAVYREYGDLNLIIGPLYGRMAVAGETDAIYHKTVYDFQALAAVLKQAGFSDIRRYDWRRTRHLDYDDFSQAYIPHMDKTNGKLISLNVEARKTK